MFRIITKLTLVLISIYSVSAQSSNTSTDASWVEWENNPHISIKYRQLNNKPLIEIKTKFMVNSTISGFILFIQDTNNISQWLDKVKTSEVLEQKTLQSNTFITQFNSFWPIKPRYMVVDSLYWQNSDLSVEIEVKDNKLEKYLIHNKIKVEILKAHWLITPQPNNNLTIEYNYIADPNGKLPFWLIKRLQLNSIKTTMNSLKQQLPHSMWQSHQLPHITELKTVP